MKKNSRNASSNIRWIFLKALEIKTLILRHIIVLSLHFVQCHFLKKISKSTKKKEANLVKKLKLQQKMIKILIKLKLKFLEKKLRKRLKIITKDGKRSIKIEFRP